MTLLLRDPTAEIVSALRPRRPVLDTLVGKCVALLDIGKMRGDEFIGRLECSWHCDTPLQKADQHPNRSDRDHSRYRAEVSCCRDCSV